MQDLRCAPDETPLHYRDPLYMEEEEEEQSGGAPPGELGGGGGLCGSCVCPRAQFVG